MMSSLVTPKSPRAAHQAEGQMRASLKTRMRCCKQLLLSPCRIQRAGDPRRLKRILARYSGYRSLASLLKFTLQCLFYVPNVCYASQTAEADEYGLDGEEEEEDDEQALALALQMSMAESADAGHQSGSGSALDADFVNQLLGSVGVDQNDPLMQAALEQLAAEQAAKDDKRPNPNTDGKGGEEDGNDSKKRRG